LNRTDAGADELHDLAADCFHHPPYLAIAAFADSDFDVRVLAGIAYPFHFGGTRGTIAEFDPAAQSIERFIGDRTSTLHQVGFGDFVIGVREPLRELSIVGEDQKAAGIEIQTTYRGNEGVDIGDQIVNSGPPFRVFEGSDAAGGLVEQDVYAIPGLEWLFVEEDFVAIEVDPLVGVFDYASVDANAARVNPTAGLRAGAEAGFGDCAVEGFGFQWRLTLARPVLPPLSETRITRRCSPAGTESM
jgi:hypothetical protein